MQHHGSRALRRAAAPPPATMRPSALHRAPPSGAPAPFRRVAEVCGSLSSCRRGCVARASPRHSASQQQEEEKAGQQDSSSSSNSRKRQPSKEKGSSGGGGPPPPSGASLEAQVLAGHAINTGLWGSLAVAAAHAAHVDLWGLFDWSAWEDLALALALSVPLQVANLAIMAPDYESWSRSSSQPLPLEPGLDASSSSSDSSTTGSTATTTGSSTTATAPVTATAPQPEGGTSTRVVPARQWGRTPSSPPPHTLARTLRDGAWLAQAHYVMNNPTARVGPLAELGVASLETLATELMFRGLLLTCTSTWVAHQLVEAGWNDPTDLPAAWFTALAQGAVDASVAPGAAQLHLDAVTGALVVAVPLNEVALWASGGVALGLLGLLALRRAVRIILQVALMNAIRERLLRPAPQEEQQPQQQQQGGSSSQAPSTAAPSTDADGITSPSTSTSSTPTPPPPRPIRLKPRSSQLEPWVLGAALQCSRDLMQGSTMTVAFVATGGNLAACFTASLLNQVVFSALQRLCAQRSRKRRIALAAELRQINARLSSITQGATKIHARSSSTHARSGLAAALPPPATDTGNHPATHRQDSSTPSSAGTSPPPSPSPPEQQQLPATGMARTLGVLSLLVPDPPAAAKGPAAPEPRTNAPPTTESAEQQGAQRDA